MSIRVAENQGRFPVPTLSIIIPVPDSTRVPHSAELLESTLLTVLENRPEDAEILVVHCGNYADPYDLTDEVSYVKVPRHSTLADCIHAGVEASHGTIVHLLASGMRVQADWMSQVLYCFEDPDCGAVSPVIVDKHDRVLATGLRLGLAGTRRLRCHKAWSGVDGPLVEAAFYRRDVLLDLLEVNRLFADVGSQLLDVDLAMSLKVTGYRTVVVSTCHILGPAPAFTKETGFVRGLHAERLFMRHAASVGWVKALFLHPLACGWQTVVDLANGIPLTTLIGRLVGLLSLVDIRQYQFAMAELREVKRKTDEIVPVDTIRLETTQLPRVQAYPGESYPRARAG